MAPTQSKYAEESPQWLFVFMRNWFKLSLFLFYNRLQIEGLHNVPQNSPMILCMNHANSLTDAIVSIGCTPRQVRLTAKETLWNVQPWRFFVTNTGTVPVKRRQDNPNASGIDNSEAFTALFSSLAKGSCVGLFPEGISRWHSEMAPLKTGVARIAISFIRQEIENGVVDPHVYISPCGITYLHRAKFRSSVLVNYGEPIRVDSSMLGDKTGDADNKLASQLTAEIQRRLLTLTISSPTWDILHMSFLASQLQRNPKAPLLPLVDYVSHARDWNTIIVQKKEDPLVSELIKNLLEYQTLLSKIGMNDTRIARSLTLSTLEILRRLFFRFIGMSLLLGIAAPGIILSLPMIIAWRVQEQLQFKKKGGAEMNYDEVAMYKKLYLFTFLPALNIIYAILASYYGGYRIGFLVFSLFSPFLWLTTRWFEDGMSSMRAFHSLFNRLFLSSATLKSISDTRSKSVKSVIDVGLKYSIKVPQTIYNSGSFFSLFGRRQKDWNETLRPYDIAIGD